MTMRLIIALELRCGLHLLCVQVIKTSVIPNNGRGNFRLLLCIGTLIISCRNDVWAVGYEVL